VEGGKPHTTAISVADHLIFRGGGRNSQYLIEPKTKPHHDRAVHALYFTCALSIFTTPKKKKLTALSHLVFNTKQVWCL
jgi:hypothetical protein